MTSDTHSKPRKLTVTFLGPASSLQSDMEIEATVGSLKTRLWYGEELIAGESCDLRVIVDHMLNQFRVKLHVQLKHCLERDRFHADFVTAFELHRRYRCRGSRPPARIVFQYSVIPSEATVNLKLCPADSSGVVCCTLPFNAQFRFPSCDLPPFGDRDFVVNRCRGFCDSEGFVPPPYHHIADAVIEARRGDEQLLPVSRRTLL